MPPFQYLRLLKKKKGKIFTRRGNRLKLSKEKEKNKQNKRTREG